MTWITSKYFVNRIDLRSLIGYPRTSQNLKLRTLASLVSDPY